jgi:hypothetical protein
LIIELYVSLLSAGLAHSFKGFDGDMSVLGLLAVAVTEAPSQQRPDLSVEAGVMAMMGVNDT